MNSHQDSGQALVLVLLSLSVVLTIVLFVLSRSITDIAVSTSGEEAIRAFSAAEAGVEKALVLGPSGGPIGDANFSASVESFAEGQYQFNYPLDLASGDSATIWFVSHDDSGSIICDAENPCFSGNQMKVCWGESGTSASSSTTPAIEISVFYDDGSIKIGRGAFDPYSGRPTSNFFSQPDSGTCTISDKTYEFQKTIDFSDLGAADELLFAKVRMFYNSDRSHGVGVDVNFPGNDALPSQGNLINSTGTSGESVRRVEVFQSFSEPPSIFDSAVFSSTGLTK